MAPLGLRVVRGECLKHGPGLETLAALSRRGPRALRGTRLLRISGKGGVHEVGTVVFTVSAQFGVPVTSTWASTRGITSFARRIVNPPAEVEALAMKGSASPLCVILQHRCDARGGPLCADLSRGGS